MKDSNLRTVAKSMVALLVAMPLIAVDFTWSRWESASRYLPDGSEGKEYSGYRFDVLPDELGHALIGLAFVWLAGTARGRVSLGLRTLAVWQLALIALTFRGHFVYSDPLLTQPENGALGLAKSLACVAAAWLIACACGQLNLDSGERSWKRVMKGAALLMVFVFGSTALFLLTADGASLGGGAAGLGILSGIGVALLISVGCLVIAACLTTRSEALQNERPGGAAVREPEFSPGPSA